MTTHRQFYCQKVKLFIFLIFFFFFFYCLVTNLQILFYTFYFLFSSKFVLLEHNDDNMRPYFICIKYKIFGFFLDKFSVLGTYSRAACCFWHRNLLLMSFVCWRMQTSLNHLFWLDFVSLLLLLKHTRYTE